MIDGKPSGTLAFLFSDIEGSTRLEQSLGTARYTPILQRHRELLRAAFAANGGTEEGTEGDSFFVVFPSARDAIAAAVEGQRALGAEAWPPDGEIRVRMGLNAGEAARAGGSLVGLEINRAARIAAVANGGQIVVSDAVRGRLGATGSRTSASRSRSSRSSQKVCPRSSRRCGRSTPARTTCRRS